MLIFEDKMVKQPSQTYILNMILPLLSESACDAIVTTKEGCLYVQVKLGMGNSLVIVGMDSMYIHTCKALGLKTNGERVNIASIDFTLVQEQILEESNYFVEQIKGVLASKNTYEYNTNILTVDNMMLTVGNVIQDGLKIEKQNRDLSNNVESCISQDSVVDKSIDVNVTEVINDTLKYTNSEVDAIVSEYSRDKDSVNACNFSSSKGSTLVKEQEQEQKAQSKVLTDGSNIVSKVVCGKAEGVVNNKNSVSIITNSSNSNIVNTVVNSEKSKVLGKQIKSIVESSMSNTSPQFHQNNQNNKEGMVNRELVLVGVSSNSTITNGATESINTDGTIRDKALVVQENKKSIEGSKDTSSIVDDYRLPINKGVPIKTGSSVIDTTKESSNKKQSANKGGLLGRLFRL